jgi:uncharacterized protein YdiU (UPF0061 family)
MAGGWWCATNQKRQGEFVSTTGFHFDNSYHRLTGELFADVTPMPVARPDLLLYNEPLATRLGLPELTRQEAATYFSGNQPIAGSAPLSQAYVGHQFGYPAMLGDGRCVLLGEQVAPDGERFDIQLKGSGRTPFSRGGDGRAALGPMLREYLISEAMHALGIPTTRSLAVVATGESVERETSLPGAILTRVASSHIRIGTFQYASWHKGGSLLPKLLTYTIKRHYPALLETENPALALLQAVMEKQVALVVNWMRVGFVHGVLNTDNVTISGESIDFGPCAFMDNYDPATVFSSIDHDGRYAFGNQPSITQWNLSRLAEALLPEIDADESKAIALASQLLDTFTPCFDKAWGKMMRTRLGLAGEQEGDAELIMDWLKMLQEQNLDYTNAHRALCRGEMPIQTEQGAGWHKRWQARTDWKNATTKERMIRNNPAVIPRNHLVNRALALGEAGDMSEFQALLATLATPYTERTSDDPFCQPPAENERVCQTFCGT